MLKEVDNSELNNFYESINIFTYSEIFVLGFLFAISLTNLSYELLVSSIHIITFIGAIASISDYNNIFLLRVLFTISISIAIMP
jgi:hypothetical protein